MTTELAEVVVRRVVVAVMKRTLAADEDRAQPVDRRQLVERGRERDHHFTVEGVVHVRPAFVRPFGWWWGLSLDSARDGVPPGRSRALRAAHERPTCARSRGCGCCACGCGSLWLPRQVRCGVAHRARVRSNMPAAPARGVSVWPKPPASVASPCRQPAPPSRATERSIGRSIVEVDRRRVGSAVIGSPSGFVRSVFNATGISGRRGRGGLVSYCIV